MKMMNKKKLLKEFETIPDYRVHKHKIVYPLHEIIFLTLSALLQGQTTYDDIHTWMKYNANGKFFKRLFGKRKVRIPSYQHMHFILHSQNNT